MPEQSNPKVINAWCIYDLANSVYALIINATIFPIYYVGITHTQASDNVKFLGFNFINTALYTYALSFSFLLIALLSPLLSGIADYTGQKKRFMQFFCYLGAVSCSMMFFFTSQTLSLGILLVVLSSIGYAGSIVFYNAFLPEIAPPKEQDYVSAKGFALGYLGSTILLLFNLALFLKPDWFGGISSDMAARVSFLTVGIWWASFAQITFYHLPKEAKQYGKGNGYLWKGFRELLKVWKELRLNPQLTHYLQAFFVYNMGVQTVILVATIFGKKELKLGTEQLIFTIMLLQFVAIGGAFLFSKLSSLLGNVRSLQLATFIWVVICIAAYFITTAAQFYVLAFAVGMVMGGIQSLSRSTYSKMLPQTLDHASYFSFYDVCEKIGIVIGTAVFGLAETLTENLRYPILSLITFFVGGFLLLQRVRK